jgi:hypothetical protein
MSNGSGATARLWATALMVAALTFCGSASATLLERGSDMVYDNVLDITWTRQAGDGVSRFWADSVVWADNLVFAGFDDWRLPWASVSAGAGPTLVVYSCTGSGGADELACRDNELGYMFYYNLDGNLEDDKTGTQTAVGGEVLTGIQPRYWSGTDFDSGSAWGFDFGNGHTFTFFHQNNGIFAWAVRDGDVGTAQVPEPETYALMLAGLGLLGFMARRRQRVS